MTDKIKPEMVPLAVLRAYSKALGENGEPRHAIAAALNAWPGMRVRLRYFHPTKEIILTTQLEDNT